MAASTALLTVAMTCLGQTAAHAASLQVTNLNDDGPGSLRAAIATANGATGAEVITFAPGLSGKITLTSGQLTITDSLQITGPGRGALTIDGNAASRVFDIPLSPGDVAVSISGLTVSNGNAQTGGGIRVQDESLMLDDVALTGNTALGNGGGLYADGFAATVSVRNSTISGNAAGGGGGAYIEDTKGATVFDGVVIDGNTASEKGGGLFFYDPDADVVIDNATITNNVARKGGGIYLYSQDKGSFTISNSSISGNQATTGGGVYLYDIDHPVSISNSTISGNTAVNGGGINVDRISAPAVISGSTISGNTATGAGGGVRLARGGGLTIAHSTITANSAANAGGARFPGPVTLSHAIVAGNAAGSTADLHAAGGATTDFSIIGTMIGAVTDGGGNQFGVADPMLAPLTNNGGPTPTHRPLAGSPAIDTGNPVASGPATDQRGMPRVVDTIDIGAVEIQGSTIQLDSTSVVVAGNAGAVGVTLTRTGVGDLPATVDIATADGTAIASGIDRASTQPDPSTLRITPWRGQLSWAAGETGTKTIAIPVVFDGAHQLDETFSVVLSGPTGATLGANTSLIVTVQNSDATPAVGLIPDPSNAEKAALLVTGTGGVESVHIKDGGRGRVLVSINGRVIGTYVPTGTIIVDTKGGTDRIVVESGIKLAQLLFGGDGSDTIQSGQGRAVIIGGQGDDKLDGYKGRDVIIGGPGIDTLRGRDNDDIVIAGPTTYDAPTAANMAKLYAIDAEWARTDPNYATRVGRISGAFAGGLNGLSTLRAGITVIDDIHKDALQGDSGTDWYIANRVPPGTTPDTLRDRSSSENITEL